MWPILDALQKNHRLWGVTIAQASAYYRTYSDDKKFLKFLKFDNQKHSVSGKNVILVGTIEAAFVGYYSLNIQYAEKLLVALHNLRDFSTQKALDKLVLYYINIGALTIVVVAANLISNHNSQLKCDIYVNSMLVSLNIRQSIRRELATDSGYNIPTISTLNIDESSSESEELPLSLSDSDPESISDSISTLIFDSMSFRLFEEDSSPSFRRRLGLRPADSLENVLGAIDKAIRAMEEGKSRWGKIPTHGLDLITPSCPVV
ncbi:hypothetical protein D9757_012018 [Collybiopsis confluens]|uniref:DUF6534 domain-containing protein n=1 Tax=Collybiopsis confluens TaxID=2823264 RepID=A0A8H5GSD8_9AGAR|nr:hypothetical protein D9757_012018 [Collybiopsis confluens]